MNFDIGNLMNIMQMFGGTKNGSPFNTDGMQNLSKLFNTFSNINTQSNTGAQSSNTYENNNFYQTKNFNGNSVHRKSSNEVYNQSDDKSIKKTPFASQNGIGERIETFSDTNAVNQQKGNPQSSGGNDVLSGFMKNMSPDMLSNLLPMLMNMGKPTAKVAKDNDTERKNDNDENKNQGQSNKINDYTCLNNDKLNEKQSQSQNHNDCNDNKKFGEIKKQPTQQKDMFEPIAFAGYGLKSALNKLFVTSKYHLHTADEHRTMQ